MHHRGLGISDLDILDDPRIDRTLEPVIDVVAAARRVEHSLPCGVLARALAGALGLEQLLRHGLVHRGQEDDLAVGGLGHGLHGLEVADLHGGCGGEDVGGLRHIHVNECFQTVRFEVYIPDASAWPTRPPRARR